MSTTLGRRRATVHLYRGDDLDRLAELSAAVSDARAAEEAAGSSRLLCDTGAVDATAAYNAYLAEAKARATKVVLEALGRHEWRSLTAAHPPREKTVEGEDGKTETVTHEDDISGVNYETFPEALIPLSIVEPAFESVEDRAAFVDDLSDPDFWRLYGVAWVLNRSAADPKALPVYEPIPVSDAT